MQPVTVEAAREPPTESKQGRHNRQGSPSSAITRRHRRSCHVQHFQACREVYWRSCSDRFVQFNYRTDGSV